MGYVILEWNQAGGPAELADTDLCTGMEEAEISLGWHKQRAADIGRKDRYAIARVYIEDDAE